ncbi:MAG: glutamate formimidoyltransferase [candidate division Zixibacteria bacterium]|nr:glutamate formimidoyltransferase [candidate division Zixibacteria bacterium]
MAKIVEAVPNFSDGRRPEVIKSITDEITSVPGVVLLDAELDGDHNRAVVTIAGEPEAVKAGLFLGIKKASEVIDLRTHQGEHPRMGATDVCPFVPISDITTAECIELAKSLGEEVGKKLGIPVYLYDQAATRPERVRLPDIRNKHGEYEGIKEQIATNDDLIPDYGPRRMHEQAGAVAIGVRLPLIAFNAYLATDNLKIAKRIAKAVRSNSGGYAHCRALGFGIAERNCVQVSMNLVNYLQTPPYRVLETIKSEAARWGTTVTSTEIVGLVPNEALINVARWYLMLENFDKDQVLEIRLDNALEAQASSTGLKSFIDTVASSAPAPGGGSVSAVAGSLAGALGAMVCRLTIGKKQYAEVQERMSELLKKTDTLKEELNTLVKKDADSFDAVMAAMKLPKDTDEQKQKRQEEIQQATIVATKIPLEVMRHSLETIKLAAEIAEIGNVNSVSDAGVGALMGRTAVEGAYYNVMINLPGIEDREIVDKIKTEAESILAQAEESVKLARRIVVEKIR